MRRSVLFALTSLAFLAAGCGGTTTATLGADDVAVVGSKEISKEQFQAILNRAKKSYDAQKRPFPKPGSVEYEQLKGQAITFLVQRAEFEQEAQEMGVEISDEKVDKRIKQLKKQFYGGSEERYHKALDQQGLTEEQARDEVRALLVSEGLFKKVTEDVKVSEQDVKSYYDTHTSQYGKPQSRDVRHILVQKKPLADRLYAQLKQGASFATLAKKYSKDPGSASTGGKLTISKGQTVPQFDKAAFSLSKDELSKPIKTQYGYHIIQALSKIRPAQTTPLKDVQGSIKQQLEQQKKNETMTEWVQDTKEDYCDSGIKYQVGYGPSSDPNSPFPDPCKTTGVTTDK